MNQPSETFSSTALLGFDSLQAVGEFKQSLIWSFSCGSVSSGTVAALFDQAPILRRA